MNKTLSIFACGLVGCGLSFGQNTVPINPALNDVAANLKAGGDHYSLTSTEGDLEKILGFLDNILKEVGKHEKSFPQELSATQSASALGLLEFTGCGSSATSAGEKGWHNRSYIAHKGSKVGLLKFLGEETQAWQAPEFAPAGADLVLETSLDLRSIQSLATTLLGPINKEAVGEMNQVLAQPLFPGAKMTIGQMLEKLNIRGSIALTLDKSKQWEAAPGVKLPGFDVIARLDGAAPFWPLIEENIGEVLPKEEKEGFVIYKAPGAVPTPFGVIEPALAYDSANGQLWIRLVASPLADQATSTTNLASTSEYKAAVQDFPNQGSSLFYLSQEGVDTITDLIELAIKLNAGRDEDMAFVSAVVIPAAKEFLDTGYGFSACIASQEKGLLFASNGPIAFKDGGGMLSSVSAMAALSAGVATPAILKQREKAELIGSVNNLKQCHFFLLDYYAEEGKFPSDLESLITEGYVDPEASAVLQDEDGTLFYYVKGLSMTDNATRVLAYSKPKYNGKRAVLLLDGAVILMSNAEFQRALKIK